MHPYDVSWCNRNTDLIAEARAVVLMWVPLWVEGRRLPDSAVCSVNWYICYSTICKREPSSFQELVPINLQCKLVRRLHEEIPIQNLGNDFRTAFISEIASTKAQHHFLKVFGGTQKNELLTASTVYDFRKYKAQSKCLACSPSGIYVKILLHTSAQTSGDTPKRDINFVRFLDIHLSTLVSR